MFSESAAIRGIHLQQADRRSANRCAPDNEDPVALEVLIPLILTWVEQSDECAAFGVKGAEIGPLMCVAVITGESEVFTGVSSAMLASDDVLDVIGEKRLCCLRQATVFAATPGPLIDTLPEPPVHLRRHDRQPRAGELWLAEWRRNFRHASWRHIPAPPLRRNSPPSICRPVLRFSPASPHRPVPVAALQRSFGQGIDQQRLARAPKRCWLNRPASHER